MVKSPSVSFSSSTISKLLRKTSDEGKAEDTEGGVTTP